MGPTRYVNGKKKRNESERERGEKEVEEKKKERNNRERKRGYVYVSIRVYTRMCIIWRYNKKNITREKNMKNYWYEFNVANACRNVVIFEAGDVYYFSRN